VSGLLALSYVELNNSVKRLPARGFRSGAAKGFYSGPVNGFYSGGATGFYSVAGNGCYSVGGFYSKLKRDFDAGA
jgi:hypothetical protein